MTGNIRMCTGPHQLFLTLPNGFVDYLLPEPITVIQRLPNAGTWSNFFFLFLSCLALRYVGLILQYLLRFQPSLYKVIE